MRALLRQVLYSVRIKPMYQRVKVAGKPGKVAIVAGIRKLPVILDARARDHH